jgi:hypothetical protein
MQHPRADFVPVWAREYLRASLAGAMEALLRRGQFPSGRGVHRDLETHGGGGTRLVSVWWREQFKMLMLNDLRQVVLIFFVKASVSVEARDHAGRPWSLIIREFTFGA